MTPINLLGDDIRSQSVADFLESRDTQVELEVVEDRVFISANDQGVAIMAGPDYRIDTLHFYADGVQGCSQYQGDLPLLLRFGQSHTEVQQQKGPPSQSGGGNINARGEEIPFWARYDFPEYSLHLQYSGCGERLELVTLMSREIAP